MEHFLGGIAPLKEHEKQTKMDQIFFYSFIHFSWSESDPMTMYRYFTILTQIHKKNKNYKR